MSNPDISAQNILQIPHATLAPLTPLANDFIGKFQDISVNSSPTVETASIHPLCARGDLLTISALAGIGKTTFGTDLIIGAGHPDRHGLSLGGLFHFNLPDGRPIKCAIIDAESTLVRWQSIIFRKLELEGLKPQKLGCIRYLRASDFNIHNAAKREIYSRALAEALAHDRCEFVLIDTIGAAWAPSQINDPDWVFSGLKPFRESCQKHGITMLGFAHTSRKSGNETESFNPIGSSFQENQADVQLSMVRLPKNGPDGIQLTLRKSRRSFWISQGSSVSLRFTPEYGYEPVGNWQERWPHDWDCEGTVDDDCELPTRFRIEKAVKEEAPNSISAKTIASLTGIPDRTVRNNLSKLKDQGIVECVGDGPATTWRYVK